MIPQPLNGGDETDLVKRLERDRDDIDNVMGKLYRDKGRSSQIFE